MKTPPNDADAVMRKLLRDTELGTVCTVGLLACSRALCGHFGHARLANSDNYWLRRSSPNCLANRLAIIASPS